MDTFVNAALSALTLKTPFHASTKNTSTPSHKADGNAASSLKPACAPGPRQTDRHALILVLTRNHCSNSIPLQTFHQDPKAKPEALQPLMLAGKGKGGGGLQMSTFYTGCIILIDI